MKKHHGLTDENDLYLRIKDVCFKRYKDCFDTKEYFQAALERAKLASSVYGLVYQDRFMMACGKENLKNISIGSLGVC